MCDRYGPLAGERRGREAGGVRVFADGSYYGCCVSIAAAGIALFPLLNVLQAEKGAAVLFYLDGTARAATPDGQTANNIFPHFIHPVPCDSVERTLIPKVFAKQIETGTTIIFGVSCPFAAALLVGDIFFGHLLQKIDWSRVFRFDMHL